MTDAPTTNAPVGHDAVTAAVDRRTMLVAGGLSFCGMQAPELFAAQTANSIGGPRKTAKSTILIWLSGGASHIDTWDMKPEAPREFRGPFEPIDTSVPGISLCEHLPHLSKQAHHLAVVRSLGHYRRGTGDHHAGYYYNLTGHAPDPSFPRLLNNRTPRATDWPFIGSVVGYKVPPHPYLPQVVSLPIKPGAPSGTCVLHFPRRGQAPHRPSSAAGVSCRNASRLLHCRHRSDCPAESPRLAPMARAAGMAGRDGR